ncbi:MAG: Asp-tRNA(Asn)/Glu-tRNA(Gln) amidotransferase subunit GatB [Bacteroidota bacterium]|nr:Asp-tRNA(Asn)/Glu-tRNA(Gln) amidotransferase subunit GatB [Bacteroidota bacterium]
MNFTIRIGLEVHIQLKTATKLFSDEPVTFEQKPNQSISPVTVGLPGTLPSLNQKAIDLTIILALAANCKINHQITFDRKIYFYPDLPKGYQITQKANPIGLQGAITYINHKKQIKKINIKQIHLEEDSAKLIYKDHQLLIDYNRAGIPLAEVVTYPELKSPEEAVSFLEYLKFLSKELNISSGKMQMGAIRCDANISVNMPNKNIGYNEIKNLNSTKALKYALRYEIDRQKNEFKNNTFKRGFTLSFDEQQNKTIFSREKVSVADYGYIIEPDILPITITRSKIDTLKTKISELPAKRFQRLIQQYQLKKDVAYTISLNHDLSMIFESVYPEILNKQELIHFLLGPFKSTDKKYAEKSYYNKKLKSNIISLLNMITQNKISRETAYQNLWPKLLVSKNKTTFELAKSNKWLLNHNETELLAIIKKIISEYPEEVEKYKNGKSKIIGLFMGQIMKRTKYRFQPQRAKLLLIEELNKINV